MPLVIKEPQRNYSDMDHFKEETVKRINNIYRDVVPFDIFDFSTDEGWFQCVAYLEAEGDIPAEQAEGEPLSEEAAAAAKEGYSLEDVLNATDAAIALAAEHKVDLKDIEGSGAEGNILKGDVVGYLKAREENEIEAELNKAPDQENADNEDDEQQPPGE